MAVTVSGPLMVTLVEELAGFATAPIQLANWKVDDGATDTGTPVPAFTNPEPGTTVPEAAGAAADVNW